MMKIGMSKAALVVLVLAVCAIGWFVWNQLAHAEAVARDSTAPDYLRAYAAAQANYYGTHGAYASIHALHASGGAEELAAEIFEREGYRYVFTVSPDGARFSATATPTWRHGRLPSYWYIDSAYLLTRSADGPAGPNDAVSGNLSELRPVSSRRPN